MPELSYRFYGHTSEAISELMYELHWHVGVAHSKDNFGIAINCILDGIQYDFDERSEAVISWDKKKERFWKEVSDVFLREYFP
jgi:hypothetical protein